MFIKVTLYLDADLYLWIKIEQQGSDIELIPEFYCPEVPEAFPLYQLLCQLYLPLQREVRIWFRCDQEQFDSLGIQDLQHDDFSTLF